MDLSWIQLAGLMMFLAVTLGAFGTHSLRDKIPPASLEIFKTGILYQFVHSIGLFIVAWLVTQSADARVHFAGLFFLTGIFLFCGSLYLLAVTQAKWFGAITPIGGLCFLAGWTLIIHSHYIQNF